MEDYSVILDDSSDITQPNFTVSKQYKTPKKIDYWYYAKTESLLREQISRLESQLNEANSIISKLSEPEVRTEVKIVEPKEYKPVGNRVNVLAQMEAKDREEYWKGEIKRREEEAAKSNVVTVEH